MPRKLTVDPAPAQAASSSAAKPGTAHAIDPPPTEIDQNLTGGEPIAPAVPNPFHVRRAERVLSRMIEATPHGAARPWRTTRSLNIIRMWIEEGISEGDLVRYVQGASQLVGRGREAPHWWTVGNLFGERTMERWRADIAAMRAEDEDARHRESALASSDAEAREAALATHVTVTNLRLRRDTQDALKALEQRWTDSAARADHAKGKK